MKKTLKQMIGTGIVLAAGLGSLVGISGCEESFSSHPQRDQRVYALGSIAYDYTMQQERNNAIRDSGRSVVNVNYNNSQSGGFQNPEDNIRRELTQKGATLFTFNYFNDFNNSGQLDSMDEITGIKTRFRENERIILGAIINGKTKKYDSALINIPKALNLYGNEESETGLVNFKIYNPNGEEIYNQSLRAPTFSTSIIKIGDDRKFMDFLIDKGGGFGMYKAAVFVNGVFLDAHEFEITQ